MPQIVNKKSVLEMAMGAQVRLIVMVVAQPDLEAVLFGQFAPPASKQDVMLLQAARGAQIVALAAQVALFIDLQYAFCHGAPPVR